MTRHRWGISIVLCAALAAAPVFATERSRAAPPDTEEITRGEIETYARATSLVRSIRSELASRVQGVNNPQQVAMLVEAANSAMVWVVEEEGLSLERYNEISRAARANPELRSRIFEVMGEQR